MKRLFVLALFLMTKTTMAQNFGGFPPSTQWKQISNDTARVIFTPGAEWQAARITSLIRRAAADTPFAMGSRLRKINVVLHSRTTLANGYVALAPLRSEFYLIPSSNTYDFGNMPWYENLAIHEYRHVQQYNNLNNGISRVLSVIFGDQGQALGNALTVPDWFFEGDAVHSETALTTQGRGRLSYFLSGYQSLWLENRNYSWLKLRNGSLKDYVPDHYRLGYLLANYGYMKYGDEFWKHVTHDASAFKGLLYPFQHAVKKYSGVSYQTFRKQAFDYYRSQYPAKESVNPGVTKTGTVNDYYFSQYTNKDTLVYLKTSYRDIPAFYLNMQGHEEKIARRHISSEEWFSVRNHKIAYTAYSTRARWSLIDFSDIVILDLATKKQKRLTHGLRYYTPDISPSGEKIATVRINDSLRTLIDLLDAKDGRRLASFEPVANNFFSNTRFTDEQHVMSTIRSEDSKISLQLLDLTNGSWKTLIPYTDHLISNPSVRGDTVFFTANVYGNDDLFALMLSSGKVFRLTRQLTGSYFPASDGDSLAFSQFTSRGLQLQKRKISETMWSEVPANAWTARPLIFPVALPRDILNTPTERYVTRRYKKGTGLFNFHSWAPDYTDPEFTFSLYSNNILNTFANEFYYRYNQNENSHGAGWNGSYGGFFVKLNGGLEYTFHRELRFISRTYLLDQLETRVGYNIPLDFTRGNSFKAFNIGSDLVFNKTIPRGLFKDSIIGGSRTYLSHFMSWAQYRPQARQQIYPKLGYTINTAYRHLLSSYGYQANGVAQVFLPSFGNHSIVLLASGQKTGFRNGQGSAAAVFANRFAGARGYDDYYFPLMWKVAANYHFPDRVS